MKHKYHLLLLLYFIAGLSTLYGQIEFYTDVPALVSVNQPFEVSFVLKNGDGKNPKFPNFEGFSVLSGPSISSSTTIINGQRSSEQRYSFTLMSESKGNKVIGIATIQVDKKTFYTSGNKVDVITAKEESTANGGVDGWAILAKAKASKNKIYVGEQIVMNYNFYYGEQLGVTDRPTLPAFKDFFVKKLEIRQQELPALKVGGRMYNGVMFDAIALFPQTVGDKVISPATYHLEKQDRRSDPFNPFGGSIQKSVPTNSSSIKVLPLPAYDKQDFSGVVGSYTLDGNLSSTNITTDQTATIRLEIKGNGDAMQLTPPNIAIDPSLEVFPPKLISSNETFENNELSHLNEYEYIIKAKKEGTYPINIAFVYFDPSSSKYTKSEKQFGPINVSKGAKKSFNQFYSGESSQTNNPMRYAILFGCLALAGLIYFYKRPSKGKAVKTESLANSNMSKIEKLNQRASAKLARAKALMDNNESEAFFREVEISINQVVQEKFQLTNEDMTKQRLKEIIKSTYQNTDLSEDYMGIFTKVDMARYAGSSTQNRSAIYTKAMEFIKDFESMNSMK